LRVARLVLTPTRRFRSAVVAYPLADDLSDEEVTLMANLVTLSPGTLSLEVSPDRRTLYVHVMDLGAGPDVIRAELCAGLEAPLRRWSRGTRARDGRPAS
jgi:multicomponent Na+:H+ antiporter subunit E